MGEFESWQGGRGGRAVSYQVSGVSLIPFGTGQGLRFFTIRF